MVQQGMSSHVTSNRRGCTFTFPRGSCERELAGSSDDKFVASSDDPDELVAQRVFVVVALSFPTAGRCGFLSRCAQVVGDWHDGCCSNLVSRIVAGHVDALVITCQIQFRHLFEIARRKSLEQRLLLALRQRVAVAAVGPTCHAVLQAHGIRVHVMPDQPRIGPLVSSLMRHLEQRHPGGPLRSRHDSGMQ
jgi:hypothetical protein